MRFKNYEKNINTRANSNTPTICYSHFSDLLKDKMSEGGVNKDQMLQSPMRINDQSGLLEDEMDKKENLFSVQENNLGSSMQRKRNRNGGGCNLNKSLAWNQAFFIEEGVLNPLELSLLNKSSIKSNGNHTSVSEMSPFSGYNKNNVRPPLRSLATHFQSKDSKPKKSSFSINEGPAIHASAGRTPTSKAIFRRIPRSPATYSQTRVANVRPANPTSKLPKIKPLNLYPPPTTSGTMLAKKSSNLDRSSSKVNIAKNAGVRLPDSKTDSACSSSSSNFSGDNHGKNLVKNCTITSKVIPNRPSLTEHELCSSRSVKVASSLLQSMSHVPQGLSSPSHSRPSALRMPSPSLGFFCQGKVSPSYNNQLQRHPQPSESKGPSVKQPKNMRPNSQLQILDFACSQQLAKSTAAEISTATSLMSTSCLESSYLNPLATLNANLHVETNSEKKQDDIVDRRASSNFGSSYCQKETVEDDIVDWKVPINFESSYCQKGSHENSGFDHTDTCKQSGVLHLDKPDSCWVKELDCCDISVEISNESSVQGFQQFPNTNFPEVACDTQSPNNGSNSSYFPCSGEFKVCYQGEQQDCNSENEQGDSSIHNNAIKSNEEFAMDETYPVAIENIQSDVNSDLASGYTARGTSSTASTGANLSPKEEITCLDYSLESDRSPFPSSGMYDDIATNQSVCTIGDLNRNRPEKCEPTHSDEQELQDYGSPCDSTNMISSTELGSLMPRDKMGTDTSRKKILLDVIPFSDEWVAALEAFGEDILEKKTGPVQNSPPEKALPEPGPWSPVKKKAQDIGPFDCTKYSKNLTT